MDAITTPLLQWQWLLLLAVPCVLLLLHASRRRSNDDKHRLRQLPPSPPGGLPIIGHLLLVGDRPHVSFRDLAAKHDDDDRVAGGGLMLLRLGTVPNLVVSSARAAQAVLRTHDHVFASRPASALFDDLVYGSSSVGFAPYGEHWRQVRKLVTTHLLTVKKVSSYRHARQEEVRQVLDKLRAAVAAMDDAGVDLSETMNAFANDVIAVLCVASSPEKKAGTSSSVT